MKKQILMGLLLLICMVMGCSKKQQEVRPEEGVYKIYYLNASKTRLVPQDYKTDTTNPDVLIEELMHELRNVPNNVDSQPALSEKVGFLGFKREQMVLYLYFDNTYTGMKSTREILCRASLAKTLTQIDGVDFINIYSGEQPLLDASGNPVGMMAASDFIDNMSDINAYEKSELLLFFTDVSGEQLIPEKREVVHSVNTSLEKLVVEQLLDGPKTPGLCPTLSRDTKLLNVSVNENVCYINFDSTFLSGIPEVKDYIPIYSIVNSLSELSLVNKVQITIDGSQDVMFRDSISLNTLFERNLDYIGGTTN